VIITILNDGTIISIAYDQVRASSVPEHWNLRALSLAAAIIGLIAMASSLLLLHLCLQSNTDGSMLETMGMGYMSFGEIQMMLFMKISLSNFLSVFCARTTGPFWSRPPGTLMVVCVAGALVVTTLLAAAWPFGDGLRSLTALPCLYIWGYVIAWFLVQDVLKVGAYNILYYVGFMVEAEYINEVDFLFSSPSEKHKLGEAQQKSGRASHRKKYGSRVVQQLRNNQPKNPTKDIEQGWEIEL